MRVVGNLGRVYAPFVEALSYEMRQLRRSVENVAHQFPVGEVGTMIKRHPRIVTERGGYKPVVLAVAHYTRVGIPAWDYRVVELCGVGKRTLAVIFVIPLISEV